MSMTDMSRDSIVDRYYLPVSSVMWRAVNPRLTSQKIWGCFFYGVYRPEEWLWIDFNGKNETSSGRIIW